MPFLGILLKFKNIEQTMSTTQHWADFSFHAIHVPVSCFFLDHFSPPLCWTSRWLTVKIHPFCETSTGCATLVNIHYWRFYHKPNVPEESVKVEAGMRVGVNGEVNMMKRQFFLRDHIHWLFKKSSSSQSWQVHLARCQSCQYVADTLKEECTGTHYTIQ